MGYHVATREIPNFMVKAYAWIDKSVRVLLPLLGVKLELDNTRMKEVLGITPRPAEETILDMCYTLIEQGVVKKTSGFKPQDLTTTEEGT